MIDGRLELPLGNFIRQHLATIESSVRFLGAFAMGGLVFQGFRYGIVIALFLAVAAILANALLAEIAKPTADDRLPAGISASHGSPDHQDQLLRQSDEDGSEEFRDFFRMWMVRFVSGILASLLLAMCIVDIFEIFKARSTHQDIFSTLYIIIIYLVISAVLSSIAFRGKVLNVLPTRRIDDAARRHSN